MVKHLRHDFIPGESYYLINFETDSEVEEFCSNHSWYDKTDIEKFQSKVIHLVSGEDGEVLYYEIFEPRYIKDRFSNLSGVYGAMFKELTRSFRI